MSAKFQDVVKALDAVEQIVELRRTDPDVLLPELATLLLGLQRDSPHRPRVHRLLGVVHNRLKLDSDALRELREARSLAEAASPPNYRELAKIGRETAVVYVCRGDDRRAAAELLPALAFAAVEDDTEEIAKIIAEYGRIELEAQRFENVVLVFGSLVSEGARSKLPAREALRVRIDLCRALNRVGRHAEALKHIAALQASLAQGEARLRLLALLEAARAFAGLGRYDEAEAALLEAEKLLPEKETALEHSEFIEAVTELQEVRGGAPAVESLEQLIENYTAQRLIGREAVARRALAHALFRLGDGARARAALGQGLRNALSNNLVELADEVRAEMLKRAGAEHLEELAGTIDVIGGNTELDRRFVRLGVLGKGGVGEVVRAVDLADGHQVALKQIDLRSLPEGGRKAAMNAVKTECGAASQLDDPRFARVLDLRIAPGGSLYIVQRFVDGPTLRQIYASDAEPDRLLELLAGTAEALSVLHAHSVVHRDLKPENVIVTRGDRGAECPVLIDLGIALVTRSEDALKHFGTPP